MTKPDPVPPPTTLKRKKILNSADSTNDRLILKKQKISLIKGRQNYFVKFFKPERYQ